MRKNYLHLAKLHSYLLFCYIEPCFFSLLPFFHITYKNIHLLFHIPSLLMNLMTFTVPMKWSLKEHGKKRYIIVLGYTTRLLFYYILIFYCPCFTKQFSYIVSLLYNIIFNTIYSNRFLQLYTVNEIEIWKLLILFPLVTIVY